MYPVYEIDDAQAASIMATQENYLNDIKARDIKPSKLSETISAFSNAAGGDVYVGIGENKGNKWGQTRLFESFPESILTPDRIGLNRYRAKWKYSALHPTRA
jgi:predicted HTH transcriptional regulator